MSASNPLYPNLKSSLNQSETGSTSVEVRLSQSEEFGNADQNEFVFITDYQVTAYISPNIQQDYNNIVKPFIIFAVQDGDGTASALDACEKWVLRPYRFLLLFVSYYQQGPLAHVVLNMFTVFILKEIFVTMVMQLGWTDFGRGWKRVLRWMWVGLILFIIILTSLTQIFSCFRRDRVRVFVVGKKCLFITNTLTST